jgi:glycosyltransferase involved in cell wall biosynthesis
MSISIAMLGHKRIPSREGGIEIVVEELAVRMAARGYRVTCYNRSGHHVSGKEFDTRRGGEYRGVRLKTAAAINRKGLAAVTSSFFASLAAAVGPYDVVHIHAEGPAAFCWLPRLMGKRVVVTVHGLDWQRAKWKGGLGARYIHLGEKMAVRFAHEIIVLNRAAQQYFKDSYGRETRLIPNGVSRAEYAAPDRIREVFGLEKDAYLLFLGRMVPEKGIHYLIEAFQGVRTDRKLVVAGGASDSEAYIDRLKEQAGGDSRIVFTGFVQKELLRELYSNAYVYVLPSDLEGMPLSLLEALSYGCCCVTSDIPECVDVTGEHGVAFQKGSAVDLRVKLQELCDDVGQVYRRREGAADYVCRRHRWDEVVDRTLELYQK